MYVKIGVLETMTNTVSLTFVLTGEEEELQPGLLELVYQEGRQLPGECFLPEDQ
jgi:hypothetical protein